LIAIAALSVAAGMTTYLVRLKTAADPKAAATASAESGSTRAIGPDESSTSKR
jgi:hypothetical protein